MPSNVWKKIREISWEPYNNEPIGIFIWAPTSGINKSRERCLSTRSPPWVLQTTQKAESDVEQLTIQKSQLQAGTEHMDPLEQLRSAPNLWCHSAGPAGQETWSLCVSLQHLPISQKRNLITEIAVNPLCHSGLQFKFIFFVKYFYSCSCTNLYSPGKTSPPPEGSILCAELSQLNPQ